ncbi:hypothetical protein [Streptosporangium carneum]|uniref:Uncharacterized protein n=1 Tax=Streptosporangium carneum TaxID=47481 RepID=A0A9W6MGV6_9ACTN|nr:hypothetical protein [Streptosporangium carneum]GLK14184.1 hypothetical protein GCM10017600_75960 [Streptosporangium carneum]
MRHHPSRRRADLAALMSAGESESATRTRSAAAPAHDADRDRNGVWKLQVRDVHSYDVGAIDPWSTAF